ncbi:hypothetical protein ACIA8C_08460 [Nocardia sp. NPDC051321]|uniref:hypothetical protein n=1 Tax=Nocardia sp. NPDC051321 TaxID=3364323 RepID=UPI0037899C7B
MTTIPCANGHFYVVTDCVSRDEAAASAEAAGGTLAHLTSSNLAELSFPAGALDDIPLCESPQFGPIAWFATYNGGVPEGTVYLMALATGQVMNVSAHRASAWTGLVLSEPR